MHAFSTRQRVIGLQPSHVQQPPPYASVTPLKAAQSLPDYTPFYTSSATRSNSSVGLSAVHIELDQSSARVYDIEDLVTGHIVFTPKRDSAVTHAYATLSGEECSSRTKRRLNLGKFIVPIQDSRGAASGDGTAGLLVKKGRTYRFRFSIQVPMTVHSIDNENDDEDDDDKTAPMSALVLIPPSLGPTPDLGIETTHSVSYFVSACVEEEATPVNRTHLCDLPAFVTLCPSYPPQLSASGCDSVSTDRFAKKLSGSFDDCQLETTVAIARRSGLFKRANPHGIVKIRTAAPVYVDLDKSTGDVSGTVQLQLAYTAHGVNAPPPPEVSHVTVALSAITTDAHGITTTEALPLVEHPVLRPRWCPRTHTAALAVPVSVPIHTNALPTFATELLTRRYEMQATVQLRGGAVGVLHVPVMLVASVVPRHYFEYLEAWKRVAAQQHAIDHDSRRQSLAKAALIKLESHVTSGADGALLDCCQ